MEQGDTIFLKDIFNFEDLLVKYPGRRIKLRFNKNWEIIKGSGQWYDFVDRYTQKTDDFLPLMLSVGNADKKKRNHSSDIQFQFIEVGHQKWLFVGAYIILESHSQIFHWDEFGWDISYAKAERLKIYDKYIDKLIVDWKNTPQGFYYTSQDKIDSVKISSISSKSYFERGDDFPGYENVSKSYLELRRHWHHKSWQEQLSTVYGVYVITDTKTGKLYVGSAYGEQGVYGRWSAYLTDGYDKEELEDSKYPNLQLKNLVNKNGIAYIQEYFQYTLLEIFPKTELGKQKTLEREKYWKMVFKTREFGYNSN